MGRTGDPRFIPMVDKLRHDAEESVRAAAAHAAPVLAQRLAYLKKTPEIAMQVASAEYRDGWHTVRVHIQDPENLLRLDALHFSLRNGPTLV
jgi:hypothetical protein